MFVYTEPSWTKATVLLDSWKRHSRKCVSYVQGLERLSLALR